MTSKTQDKLEVGSLVRYEGRNWFVGLVNDARARLDPLSVANVASPTSGRSFATYGSSVNIGATSMVDAVTVEDLNEVEQRRYYRLKKEQEMTAVNPNPIAGEAPTDGATKTRKQLNDERVAANKARKEEERLARDKEKAEKAAQPKEPKAKKKCKCGCGGETGGNFVPGHDARFKGLLLKVERGQAKPEEVFSQEVLDAYTWKKRGKGIIPTTNYAGQPHNGYDPDAAAEPTPAPAAAPPAANAAQGKKAAPVAAPLEGTAAR